MTATDNSSRLRTLAQSRLVRIGLALLLLYALAGFLIAPWLVQRQIPSLAENHLGARASVASIRINPFLLTFEAAEIAIAEKSGAPIATIGRIFVDFEASSLFRRAWTFREIRLERPEVNAEIDDRGILNFSRLGKHRPADAAVEPAAENRQPPRLLFQHFAITQGRLSIADHSIKPVAQARFDPINLEMHDLSTLPDHRGEHVLTARLPGGGNLKWQGKVSLSPFDSSGSFQLNDGKLATLWRFEQDQLAIREPAGDYGVELNYQARYQGGAFDLQASNLTFRMKDVEIAGEKDKRPLARISAIAFEDGSFDLGQRSIAFGKVHLADSAINVVLDQEGTADWSRLMRPTPSEKTKQPSTKPADENPASSSWKLALPKVAIGPIKVSVTDHSRTNPLSVTLDRAETELGVAAAFGKQTQVTVDGAAIKLGGLNVRSGDDREPLLTLGSAELTGGLFDLQKKSASAGKLKLSGGKTDVREAADGTLNLATAFASRQSKPDQPSAFSFSLGEAEIGEHAISFTDQSFTPALSWNIEAARLAMSKLAIPARNTSPLDVALRVKEGGELKAKGNIDLNKLSADIRIDLANLDLRPAEVLLKQFTTLTLASGKVGASGRAVWAGKASPPAFRYNGSVAVNDVDLRTASSNEPLFSWKQLAATGLAIDSGENRYAVEQLSLAQPYVRLLINKDRTTNLADIRKRQPESPASAPGTAETAPKTIRIDRVRVENGAMDFTDLSLVLPFSTYIKSLNGAVSGLSSETGSSASLKFEGRVDEFGLARAEGSLQPFAPKKFTDIAVTFRNVALTPLSPYSATFAGRKIASGKLSLDLQYKLKDSNLAGENKVLLEQFTLGEQVESPTAVNLPLDLAIALLTDSDGKIDLAVPVTGNVDQPEFSYGHLVWQAIRTVITRIITAPFRALGALFGGGEQGAGDVTFDPGSARILPTEHEKLRRIAEGLQKRPQLKLVVQGTFNKKTDGRALRTRAVRNDLATREGLKLSPGEDPGPVAFDNPKTQRALENMLGERAGSDATAQFAEAFRKSAGSEINRVNPALALVGRGAGSRALYEALYQRLIELQPLSDPELSELANQRSLAIIKAFTDRLKFDAGRLGSKPPEPSDEAAKNGIPIKLSFEPLKS